MKSIKINFIYNLIYQILLMIIPLITAPFISRVLGSGGIGIYSYTYSIAYYFMIFAKLGLDNYGNRSIAQQVDNKILLSKIFWSIYVMQIITAGFVLIAYVLYTFFISTNKTIAIIQGCYVFSTIIDINWFFFGLEEFKLTVTRNVIIKLVTVVCIFMFVKCKNDLIVYVSIMGIGSIISQIALWPFLTKYVLFIKPSWTDIKKHFKPNIILFVPIILVSLYRIMSKIMLGNMSMMSELGFYECAEKVISLPMSVITALGIVMLPRISNLVGKGYEEEGKILIEKSMVFTIILGSAFMFGIAGVAPVLAPVFFGVEFLQSGILISFLAITIIFISWANVIRTQYIIPHSKDYIYTITSILGAVINLSFNFLFIPSMGALGAVYGTILAEATVCISQSVIVRKELDIKNYLKNGYMFVIFGLIMFVVVRLVSYMKPASISLLILQIVSGIIVYGGLSFIYCLKTKNTTISGMFNPIVNYIVKVLTSMFKQIQKRTFKD